jgi:tryptophan 2,3-dioxygenase
MPEPWASILAGLTGPYGVVIAEAVVIYFLWRLFRESEREAQTDRATLRTLSESVVSLTSEIRQWREVTGQLVEDLRGRRTR